MRHANLGPTPVRLAVRTTAAATLALATLLLAAAAHAQERQAAPLERDRLTGRVVDRASGRPLAGAVIEILDSRRWAIADTLGAFALGNPPDGRIELVVAILGYAESRLVLKADDPGAGILIELDAQPILLEGITVVSDRLRRRRNAVATSVRTFNRNNLLSGFASDAAEFVRSRAMLYSTACTGLASFSDCILIRGRPTVISVVIDEVPAIGGLDQLAMYRPEELYLLEIYAGGRHIRAYTTWFMERAAAGRTFISPVF